MPPEADIGAGTEPDAIPCDDGCGRQAILVILSLADRGVDYLCWPCLLARTVTLTKQVAEEGGDDDQ